MSLTSLYIAIRFDYELAQTKCLKSKKKFYK